ncbi:TPA: helix-turn-helix transcriptional regulator [Clostridioides difficile]|nr:helix-turn-helix transcriptional regulator [Clostridioides difficile]HBF3887702.1 helix-turn-helix transcriptional regulator [Clostridioides difficile]
MAIGENIKILRKSKGLTQKELAEKANISQNAIYNYENGKSTPNAKMLKKLADALETTPATINFSLDNFQGSTGVGKLLKQLDEITDIIDDLHKIEDSLKSNKLLHHNLLIPQYESEKIIKIHDIYEKLSNLEYKQLETIDKLIDVLIEENTQNE